MTVYSVDITDPAKGAMVKLGFIVNVEVGRDDNDAIKVLVAVEENPPTDVHEPWDGSSKSAWLVCTQDSQFRFHYPVTRPAGTYFVRARASITKSGSAWKDWKADDQRIEITVRP